MGNKTCRPGKRSLTSSCQAYGWLISVRDSDGSETASACPQYNFPISSLILETTHARTSLICSIGSPVRYFAACSSDRGGQRHTDLLDIGRLRKSPRGTSDKRHIARTGR